MGTMSQVGESQSDGMAAGALALETDERHDRELSPPRGSAGGALFSSFVDARSRARGPVVCVNSRVIAWNAAAVRLVNRGDRAQLWQWAQQAIEDEDMSARPLQLHGVTLNARCEAVVDGFELVGAVIRVDTRASASGDPERRALKPMRQSFGWDSLRESELGIAQLVADGLTNREIGARVFLSPHTVDSHLRQIFRKLGINSRVELTRLVVEHAATDSSSAA
jgi:DNA-binding CsgD family transcriptional regulator